MSNRSNPFRSNLVRTRMFRSCQFRTTRTGANPEAGFVLLAVLILVALIFIALAVAVPKVTTEIRRDKELELYHRGMQYARGVRFYYKKFGRFPGSIEQLENTNDIRFLRKRYTDPMTGKADWRIIHFGEATVRVTGLFGQPLQATSGGTGAPSIYAPTENPDGTSGTGSDPNNPGTAAGSNPGVNPGSPAGSNGFGGTSSPIGTPIGGGQGASGGGDLAGGPIVGVASSSTKESIRLFRKQTHYNQWEFIYDPLQDSGMGVNTGAGLVQQPGLNGTTGAPGVPISPTSPTSPTSPESPQQ